MASGRDAGEDKGEPSRTVDAGDVAGDKSQVTCSTTKTQVCSNRKSIETDLKNQG